GILLIDRAPASACHQRGGRVRLAHTRPTRPTCPSERRPDHDLDGNPSGAENHTAARRPGERRHGTRAFVLAGLVGQVGEDAVRRRGTSAVTGFWSGYGRGIVLRPEVSGCASVSLEARPVRAGAESASILVCRAV